MSTEVCRHIRTNGARCGSPALNGRTFCYHHVRLVERHRAMQPPPPETAIAHRVSLDGRELTPLEIQYYTPPKAPLKLDFPPLEDRESVQLALSMLIHAMAHDNIDPKRVGPLLYALQVASTNARGLAAAPSKYSMVRETVADEAGDQIAPDEDPLEHPWVTAYLAQIDREEQEAAEEDDEEYED